MPSHLASAPRTGLRRASRALLPALLLAGAALLSAALCGRAEAAWRQTRFLIGGWGVNGAPDDPRWLIALDQAGIDFVQNHDHQFSLDYGRRLVSRLDSLRAARPGFGLQAVLHFANPKSDPGRFTANEDVAAHWPAIQRVIGPDGGCNRPSTLGWFVWDEPTTRAEMANIGLLSRRMRGDPATSGQIPFVNLLSIAAGPHPSGYEREFGGGLDRAGAYAAYLDAYLSEFDDEREPAPFLSFDSYPFQEPGSLRTDYFENLRIARDRCAARGRPGARIPLWVIVQLASFKPEDGDFRPTPTIAQVRWQAWCAIAYGAKSISYWTTGTTSDPKPRTAYRGGLFDLAGRPTTKYEPVRRLNAEIHALGPTLMKLDPVTVLHVAPGAQAVTADERLGNPDEPYSIVAAVDGKGRADCLLGYFRQQEGGDPALLVVNTSLSHARTFQVRLGARADSILRIDRVTGRAVTIGRGVDSITVPDLAAASAELYRIVTPVVEFLPGVRSIRRDGTAVEYDLARGTLRVDYATGARAWVSRPRGVPATDLVATPVGVVRKKVASTAPPGH
jgi:hypothetical protein